MMPRVGRRFLWGGLLVLSVLIFSRSDARPDRDAVLIRIPSPPATASRGRADRVIVISVDGLRPDALTVAPAKTLLGLIRKGAHCPDAETIERSLTLPAHVSMLTGLDGPRHGVTSNEYEGRSVAFPTILSLSSRAGYSTAMIFAK